MPQPTLAGSLPATTVPAPRPRRHPVLVAAAGLVAAQLGFRAWALSGGWFYADDFRLLYDATTARLSLGYLFRPFDSQLMPLGRLVADLVATVGPLSWVTAATLSLAFQAVASVACVWMLVTLFGGRWGILPPLCVYLFSVLTVPATMWWAASLNQLPMQAVAFASVALWVRHLREPGRAGLLLVVAVLVVGLLAYVKTLLLLPLLLAIQLLYFTGRRRRVVDRTALAGIAALGVLGATYLAYYLAAVPQVFTATSWSVAGGLAWTMLGVAFGTAAAGGPWHWATPDPPSSLADPPAWSVVLAWAGCAAVVAASVLLRRRAGRAWLLLGGYLAGAWLLAATSRAPVVGAGIGLEYRYLTDTAAALCLVLGLAFLDLRGAPGSSAARQRLPRLGPARSGLLRLGLPRLGLLRLGGRPDPAAAAGAVVATATAAVTIGGLVSSAGHVATWQSRNPGADYLRTATADLAAAGRRVPLADQIVPGDVVPGYSHPYNATSRLLSLVPQPVSFPRASPELFVLDERGRLLPAWVDVHAQSRPGPVPQCGWPVEAAGATVPMAAGIVEYPLWMRVAYLGSGPSRVTVTAGSESVETTIRPGARTLFVHHAGGFDRVTLSGLEPGARMCVDKIEVGPVVPGLVAGPAPGLVP